MESVLFAGCAAFGYPTLETQTHTNTHTAKAQVGQCVWQSQNSFPYLEKCVHLQHWRAAKALRHVSLHATHTACFSHMMERSYYSHHNHVHGSGQTKVENVFILLILPSTNPNSISFAQQQTEK